MKGASYVPQVLEYEVDEYGAPCNVTIDGAAMKAVQRIRVEHGVGAFAEASIDLAGVQVIIRPTPKAIE